MMAAAPSPPAATAGGDSWTATSDGRGEGGFASSGRDGGGSVGESVNLLQEIIAFFEHLQPSLEKNLCQKNPILAEIALQVRERDWFQCGSSCM